MLRPDEREKILEFHRKSNASKSGAAVSSFAYQESSELFGCGAGYHHLFIDSSGEVCPCDLTPLSFGNCTQKPLEEIWREMAAWFPRPRCNCIMNQIAHQIKPDSALPLPKSQSCNLISPPQTNDPLPQAYAKLLKSDFQRGGYV
jgi:MoaA/NifB/PqqE/SkfB family radical SAM enzyme